MNETEGTDSATADAYVYGAAYGPQSSLKNPRVPPWPVPDMVKGVEWAFEIPIRILSGLWALPPLTPGFRASSSICTAMV